jgi:hypothetical protein
LARLANLLTSEFISEIVDLSESLITGVTNPPGIATATDTFIFLC